MITSITGYQPLFSVLFFSFSRSSDLLIKIVQLTGLFLFVSTTVFSLICPRIFQLTITYDILLNQSLTHSPYFPILDSSSYRRIHVLPLR